MVYILYSTNISVDIEHHKICRAQVGKGCIRNFKTFYVRVKSIFRPTQMTVFDILYFIYDHDVLFDYVFSILYG